MFDYQWNALVERRQKYLDLLQKPITVLELAEKAGLKYDAMQNHITAFMRHEDRYIKEVKKQIYKGRHRTTYVAIREEYNPEPPVRFEKREYKAKPLPPVPEPPKGITKVSSDDYHPTRCAPRRLDARIGSTFSTMAF
jgi:hypothetical protein